MGACTSKQGSLQPHLEQSRRSTGSTWHCCRFVRPHGRLARNRWLHLNIPVIIQAALCGWCQLSMCA